MASSVPFHLVGTRTLPHSRGQPSASGGAPLVHIREGDGSRRGFEQVENAEKAPLGGEQPEPRPADEIERFAIPVTAEAPGMALGASVLPPPQPRPITAAML